MSVSYTAVATSSGGGRDGQVRSPDGHIELPVRMPTTMGGNGPDETSFGITATLTGHLPGLDQQTAGDLMRQAHQVCPYSKVTRGNLDVTLRATV